MKDFEIKNGVYTEKLNFSINDGVYVTDTDRNISLSPDIEGLQNQNKMNFYISLGDRLSYKGLKTFIIISPEAKTVLGSDLKSGLRKHVSYMELCLINDYKVDYDTANEYMSDAEDIRSILAVGSKETINIAKRIATEYNLPLFIFLCAFDCDDILSPCYTIYDSGKATIMMGVIPDFVIFDLAYPLSRVDLKYGVDHIAKTLLTIFEAEYLGYSASINPLLTIIKNCLFVDFSKVTINNKFLLYSSLLSISELKKPENDLLMTNVDGVIETLRCFGLQHGHYVYPCAKLIAELYQNIFIEHDLSFCFPPDPLRQYNRIKNCGIITNSAERHIPYDTNFSLPDIADKVVQLNQSLLLFENNCNNVIIPLPKTTLKDVINASVTIQSRKGLLRDLYIAGYLA